jgi:3-dehydroshikimate dehydratase
MFRLSAFADEISPDPIEQVDVLAACGIRHIELRSVLKTNVLDLSDLQISELKSLFSKQNITLSAIGSPIGKIRIDEPFAPHLKRFERAIELAKTLGTPNIRIFSYYPAETGDWNTWRAEVLSRMEAKLRLAEKAEIYLLHENEQRIYGDDPIRVCDLFQTLASPYLRAVYDPANYVVCGFDPWQAWQKTRQWTVHFHIKDWRRGENHGCPAGEGDGRIPEVMAAAAGSPLAIHYLSSQGQKYDGFATLEPHLLGGGPTGGVTGKELFPKAVAAFRAVLDQVGAEYQ